MRLEITAGSAIPRRLATLALGVSLAAACSQEAATASYCGQAGTYSVPTGDSCECLPGYGWQNGADPDNYQCVFQNQPTGCVPDCSGRTCGPDPICGRSCGVCASGMCSDAGQCDGVTCAKDCSGRRCGPDPVCGQSCGTCGSGSCTADGACSNVNAACDLVTQAPCFGNEKCTLDASNNPVCAPLSTTGPRLEGQSCTYLASGDTCGRGLACSQASAADLPRCYRICDLNGAGSTCTYAGGSACVFELTANAGLCSLPCDPYADTCAADLYCGTFVAGDQLLFACAPTPAGGALPLGASCASVSDCVAGAVCVDAGSGPHCFRLCDAGHGCGGSSCTSMAAGGIALSKGFCNQCLPDCSGVACGPDPVCGTSCGSCAAGSTCDGGNCCTPSCAGKQCGTEPICGTSCGTCAAGSVCTAAGTCCTPDCSGRSCGLDPVCGTSCGSCSGNNTCASAGQCTCVPDCSGRSCGPDPKCGTSCGSCGTGSTCNGGSCCTPNCTGRSCGTDPVCGTPCGFCGGRQYCSGSQCASCQPLNGGCTSTSQCCQQAGVDIECQYGACEQCAGQGYDCSSVGCCSGLFCNPAGMCNPRDCSELGMRCSTRYDCCDDAVCDADAGYRCQRCRDQDVMCSVSSQCCSGLSCRSGSCQP
ncbi:MAG: hypothetical protein HY903_08030 [Deltaproteobacteria bacterium]|nr:hypothetical protein [Deltaproteobacteria bacterium]